MKRKLFCSAITFLFAFLPFFGIAQTQSTALPIDPKVRSGKLDNGLTYFIRHNEQPKQNASFYIAQAVGSILEEDLQWGLAHFLEHMAFSGTKNFPKKTLISYLETLGVKFGENLNAYTAYDRTVYNISNVPVIREGIIDSCILALHDWSGFITLKEDAIDSERKIIHEEWRQRNTASTRIMQKTFTANFAGTQYENRFPIGSMDVVDNFKYKELRDYYHKWYRPDLQAIIIVGDIDVDQVEAKLKRIFADIPKPINPAERIYYPVPDNKEPIVSVITDKEANTSSVTIFFKHDAMSVEMSRTIASLQQLYFRRIFSMMASGRFSEIAQQANPPFEKAYAYDDDFQVSQTKSALTFFAASKEGGTKKAYTTLLTEVERIKQHGFTESEYERAKTNFLKAYDNLYNERSKTDNDSYCTEYASYFTKGGTIMGIEMEYAILQQIAKNYPVKQINDIAKNYIGSENLVVSITGPEKESILYPSTDEIKSLFNDISNKKLEPYKDNVISEPLMSTLPKSGKITKEVKNDKYGTTELTLSNGTRVILKPTDFKENEILMSFIRNGGLVQLPISESANLKVINEVAGIGGLGNFSALNLRKVMTGKSASLNTNISFVDEGGSGSSTISDFETMLQLLYLNFTALRTDTTAFTSYMSKKKSAVENMEKHPMIAFQDSMNYALHKNDPYFQRINASELSKINYEKALEMFKSRFNNAAGFTFFLVGNIDIEKMKPLIAQYIGGLPGGGKYTEPKITHDFGARKESYKTVFEKELNTSKASIADIYVAQLDFTTENLIKINMLSQILRTVYLDKIRTKEGGTYGVNVSGSITRMPKGESNLKIVFETSPDRSEYLNNIIHSELKAFSTAVPDVETFNKVKEFMVKKHKEDMNDNAYWRSSLFNIYIMNLDAISSYDRIMDNMKPEDINTFAKNYLSKSRCIEIIMNGYEKK